MSSEHTLRELLRRIDGRGYRAYKEVAGSYAFDGFELHVDHVQGDPFAAPSKLRLRVPMEVAGVPADLFDNDVRRLAAADFFGRCVRDAISRPASGQRGRRGSGKSGVVWIDAGGQEVLERTAMVLTDEWLEARVHVGFPAAGRTVLGREAETILCEDLPAVVRQGMLWKSADEKAARRFVDTVENYYAIRDRLGGSGLAAFVADQSILPRRSGASDLPLDPQSAVPFLSCTGMRVDIPVPNWPAGRRRAGSVTGMGIPEGVTLIVGGGYHGKSTLLDALQRGVYPHVPGDGREYVVTDPAAVKIRAEDGRSVEAVDISPFISNLPGGRRTDRFSTDDASGSTSQAANIVEAVEAGARSLLIDEDTSATNFMVRDARMQSLVHKEFEPITPFLDRVRGLFDSHGISTILVMGGCGDYFEVADRVVMMRDYVPQDVTAEAAAIAAGQPTTRRSETAAPLAFGPRPGPEPVSFDPSRGRKEVKIDAPSVDRIRFGRHDIDLRGVEQLVDRSQTAAVGRAIHLAATRFMKPGQSLRDIVEALARFFDENGLDGLDPFHEPGRHPGDFARPRTFEVAAAINRMRTLRLRRK
jgi:predicted ABC-class ATPase